MNVNNEIAVLLLGSNLGDRVSFLNGAVELINQNCGTIFKRSSFYESAPWGFQEQPYFINQCVLLETGFQPMKLLSDLKKIESLLGRTASGKWQARFIDIDILFYGNRVIEKTNLVIPHPMMAARKFTLIPLHEILPAFIHPVFNISITGLLEACTDIGDVKFFNISAALHA
ncbi:MAG: 2-amino-4-hydroxy-6-hydroxymethyldihydropteridine diphosphokinase [Bacteroidia bacterium]